MISRTRVVATAGFAALLGVFAACKDSPTAPTKVASITAVSVTASSSTPLAVGGTVTLTATPTIATGAVVTYSWSSSNTAVATVSSSTTSTVTVTAVSPGTATITVTANGAAGTNLNAASVTNTATVTVTAPTPTLTSATPNSGVLAGGTTVTLAGTNFATGATVTVGGTAATNVVVAANGNSLTFTTPAHAAGASAIVVTNTNGTTVTLANGFTYLGAAPTVTAIAPATAPLAGGTAVTITGTGFVTGATVTIGGTAATNVVFVSATSITATAPAHAAGAVSVVVTNPDTQIATLANGFTYTAAAAPVVTSIAPNGGGIAGGSVITITGTGFGAGATVSIGGTAATAVVVNSATSITATAPAHAAGAVPVVVTNADNQIGTLAGGFTYFAAAAPAITSIAPNAGNIAGGSAITITGTGFGAGATVTIGGTAATGVVLNSATSISAIVPAHAAGAVSVVVTNADTQSATLAGGFLYTAVPAPGVTSVTPNNGAIAGGNTVTITGTGFGVGTTVTIGGIAATGVVINSATSITVTVPAHAAGVVPIVVTNADNQTGTLVGAYTYAVLGAAPTVSAVAPNSGTTAGGTPVSISGTNFAAGATVSFGGTPATGVVVNSPTFITAVTPSKFAGAVAVTVTNTDAQVGTLAAGYTFVAASTVPAITSVSPNAGGVAGGTTVTIVGSNFVVGSTVSIGGVQATGIVVNSPTRITAITAARIAGAVAVVVTNPDAQFATLNNGFTYVAASTVPTVAQVAPNTGSTAGGTAITITGVNFVTGSTVAIGGTAATNVVFVNSTTITATTPAKLAGAATVTVTNPTTLEVGSLANGFTYTAPAIRR
ncbi:MAG: IPT/TIG domain-containing protein [Gemmatimonadaceae bacterium]